MTESSYLTNSETHRYLGRSGMPTPDHPAVGTSPLAHSSDKDEDSRSLWSAGEARRTWTISILLSRGRNPRCRNNVLFVTHLFTLSPGTLLPRSRSRSAPSAVPTSSSSSRKRWSPQRQPLSLFSSRREHSGPDSSESVPQPSSA